MNTRLVLALVATLLAGCRDATKPPTPNVPKDVTGTYVLQTVNGQRLPVVVYQNATTKSELLSGTLTLADEWEDRDYYGLLLAMRGTFRLTEQVRLTENGSVSTTALYENLVYARRDQWLTFGSTIYGTEMGTATISGRTIAVVRDNHTNVYTK